MDFLTFIERMAHSLAWPVAAGFIVWALRRSLRGLLQEVTELAVKAPGAELTVKRAERAVTQAAAQFPAVVDEPPQASAAEAVRSLTPADAAVVKRLDDLEYHATRLPWARASAALLAYEELERWLRAELAKLPSPGLDGVDTSSLPGLAVAHGLLTEQQAEFLQTLRRLRDLIETVGQLGAEDRFFESTTYIGMNRKFVQALMRPRTAQPGNSHSRRG